MPRTNKKTLRKKSDELRKKEMDLLLREKDGKNYFVGSTILERIAVVDKHLSTRRYSKLTINQFVDYIYSWLLVNPNAFDLLDYFEDLENIPFPFSYDEVKAFNDTRINDLLRARIVKSALNGKARYQFAESALSELYGWKSLKEDKSDEVEEVEVKF